MSADGKIALPIRKQLKISGENDFARVHRLRSECDAVLIGVETVLSDDPKLTVKEKYVKNPKQPIRIVLDSNCRTPEDSLVVNDKANTLIVTFHECNHNKNYGENVEIISCPIRKNELIDLTFLLSVLYDKGITKLLVEGGGSVIWEFWDNNLVDDIYVYVGSMIIGGKNTPTMVDGNGISSENDLINLNLIDFNKVDNGLLLHYKLKK
jgi:2,5-diamino-6-(ribosylamino)-4(3H)-pyrimidinone 5'-phosphate reductase